MTTYDFSGTAKFVHVGTGTDDLPPGVYDITAYGAQGGGTAYAAGGAGAILGGKFTLTAGETLEIIAGGVGGSTQFVGGGGGGSFVLANTGNGYKLLLAAGGGGGAYADGAGGSGTTTKGTGAGGAASSSFGGGGGGAGYKGAGGTYTRDGYAYSGGGGQNRTGSYAGGAAYSGGAEGGFGGGGGTGTGGGGGGGGYSGGAGGYFSSGTGGGSIDKGPSAPLVSRSGANSAPGKVVIASVCYVSGTLIRTARGDVAIEELRVGDLAITASGAARPIRWLGHRAMDLHRHPRPHEAWPIRISAHAFGPDCPARDLYVSPAHAICVDVLGEVLVPAGSLVNGASIAQVEVDAVTYWHVELDSHDILIADNLPAESYIDCGNRRFFVEGGVVDLAPGPEALLAANDGCSRPSHREGASEDLVRARLRA